MKRLAALALGLLPILALCCATPKTPRQLSNAVNFNVHYTETVRVTTEPPGAHVFLDDVFIGRTPVDAVLDLPRLKVKWPWKLGTGYYGPLLVEDDGKIRVIEALAVGYRSVRSDIDIEKSQALQKLLAQYQGDAELDSVEARKKVPAKMQTESKLHFDLGTARTAAGTAMRPRTGESSSEPTLGKVTITTRMTGAEILVDGKFMGNTPAVIALTPGKHTIQVMSAGLTPYVREIQVNPGAALTIKATFKRYGDY
jgi:hypothetical protein